MAIEKKWLAIPVTPFTQDGTRFGVVTVADTAGFRVKMLVYIAAPLLPTLQLQVKQVTSPTQMIVGPPDNVIKRSHATDISAYTIAAATAIGAGEQDKTALPPDKDHYSAIYEADPVVADRVIQVDQYGRFYGRDNPMPIIFDGTVEIGEVEVVGRNGNTIEPNPNGSINVVNVPSTGSTNTVKNTFGQADAVVGGIVTTVVTYVVTMGFQAILQRVAASGENIAAFTLLINDVTQSIQRTHYSTDYNVVFDFTTGQDNGLVLQPGDVVKVTVLHPQTYTANFDARIQAFEIATS